MKPCTAAQTQIKGPTFTVWKAKWGLTFTTAGINKEDELKEFHQRRVQIQTCEYMKYPKSASKKSYYDKKKDIRQLLWKITGNTYWYLYRKGFKWQNRPQICNPLLGSFQWFSVRSVCVCGGASVSRKTIIYKQNQQKYFFMYLLPNRV